MQEKDEFLKRHNIQEKFYALEEKEPDLWGKLSSIYDSYIEQTPYLESTMQGFIKSIGESEYIHSIRYRIKNVDSLIVKIIEKKYENAGSESKYNGITVDNYYKIVTDLIGVRIIIRYRSEWQEIHKLIWKKYHKENKKYILDYVIDYSSNREVFIAEKPIVYYRHGEEKKKYEIFGKNIFDIKHSKIGYSSIHYIINSNGYYVELQVRTIFDEAWSECDHDFVYKLNASSKKLILQRCSKMLSDMTALADNLSTFMKDYYNNQIEEYYTEDYGREVSSNLPMADDINSINNYKRVNLNIDKVSDVFKIF